MMELCSLGCFDISLGLGMGSLVVVVGNGMLMKLWSLFELLTVRVVYYVGIVIDGENM